MLAEDDEQPDFPLCNWTAQRADLMEIIVGIYQADVIRMQDGSRPTFTHFARAIGHVFGITFKNPHEEMRKVLKRTIRQTPFLNRIIAAIKGKIDDKLK